MTNKSYQSRTTQDSEIFTVQAVDIVSTPLRVKHNDEVGLIFTVDTATDGAIKVRGSLDPETDLTAPVSLTNHWDYVGLIDFDSNIPTVAGNVGYQPSAGGAPAAPTCVNYRLNAGSHFHWIALEIAGRTAGSYTAIVKGITINGT